MRRRLLIYSMFFLLFADTALGVGLGVGLGLSVKNLYLYGLCGLLLVDAAMRPGGFRFSDLDIQVPFLLLILYAIITWSVKTTVDPGYSAMRGGITLKNQLVDLYLFFLVFRFGLSGLADYQWMLKAVVGTLLLSSVITLLDTFNVPNLGIVGTHRGRVEGPIGAANQYGALLAFLVPLMVSLLPTTSGKGRWLWIAGIAASILLLVATGSRGAYVAIVTGSIGATFYLRRHLSGRAVVRGALAGSVLLVLAVATVVVFQPEVVEEVTSKTQSGNVIRASSGRSAIWGAALALMNQWPASWLVGFGWNSFEASGIWKSAHSVYVDTLYELGIVGLALLLWLFAAILRKVRRAIADAPEDVARMLKGYAFGFVPLLVTMAFVEIPEPQALFWMTTGIVFGVVAHRGDRPAEAAAAGATGAEAEARAAGSPVAR